jgi:hypothetical protein
VKLYGSALLPQVTYPPEMMLPEQDCRSQQRSIHPSA